MFMDSLTWAALGQALVGGDRGGHRPRNQGRNSGIPLEMQNRRQRRGLGKVQERGEHSRAGMALRGPLVSVKCPSGVLWCPLVPFAVPQVSLRCSLVSLRCPLVSLGVPWCPLVSWGAQGRAGENLGVSDTLKYS